MERRLERRSVTVARILLSVIEENWNESWLQSMLRAGGEHVPKTLIPEIIEEVAIMVKQKQKLV